MTLSAMNLIRFTIFWLCLAIAFDDVFEFPLIKMVVMRMSKKNRMWAPCQTNISVLEPHKTVRIPIDEQSFINHDLKPCSNVSSFLFPCLFASRAFAKRIRDCITRTCTQIPKFHRYSSLVTLFILTQKRNRSFFFRKNNCLGFSQISTFKTFFLNLIANPFKR